MECHKNITILFFIHSGLWECACAAYNSVMSMIMLQNLGMGPTHPHMQIGKENHYLTRRDIILEPYPASKLPTFTRKEYTGQLYGVNTLRDS